LGKGTSYQLKSAFTMEHANKADENSIEGGTLWEQFGKGKVKRCGRRSRGLIVRKNVKSSRTRLNGSEEKRAMFRKRKERKGGDAKKRGEKNEQKIITAGRGATAQGKRRGIRTTRRPASREKRRARTSASSTNTGKKKTEKKGAREVDRKGRQEPARQATKQIFGAKMKKSRKNKEKDRERKKKQNPCSYNFKINNVGSVGLVTKEGRKTRPREKEADRAHQ